MSTSFTRPQFTLKVTYLLHGEYLMIEVTLQLLVGKVDTELLKTVLLKILKTEDVQDANV